MYNVLEGGTMCHSAALGHILESGNIKQFWDRKLIPVGVAVSPYSMSEL